MKELTAVALMLSAAFITTTVLAFANVYFTTLLFWVLVTQFSMYFATHWVFRQLKKD